MRFIVAFCAILSCCSAARAVPIYVASASATYWTATDTVEFVVNFTEPPNFVSTANEAYVSIAGSPPYPLPTNEWFVIANGGPSGTTSDVFTITYASVDSEGTLTTSDRGLFDYELVDNTLTAEVDFATLGISNPLFQFEVAPFYQFPSAVGMSSIDEVVLVHFPEPSSVIMCLLGVVGIAAHRLVRRPRLRLGLRERHVGMK